MKALVDRCAEYAQRVASQVLGTSAELKPLGGIPWRNQVYAIDGTRGVLKVYISESKKRPIREIAALRFLSTRFSYAPTVLESDMSNGDLSWCLMTFVQGAELRQVYDSIKTEHLRPIYEQMGRVLAIMHDCGRFDYFGDLEPSWASSSALSSFVFDRTENNVGAVRAIHLPQAQLFERAIKLLKTFEEPFRDYSESGGRLLHRDYTGRNVMIAGLPDSPRVSAIIDFELSHIGDPAEDFAKLVLASHRDRRVDQAAFANGYAMFADIDEPFMSRVRYHTIALCFEIASWAFDRDRAYYSETIEFLERVVQDQSYGLDFARY